MLTTACCIVGHYQTLNLGLDIVSVWLVGYADVFMLLRVSSQSCVV